MIPEFAVVNQDLSPCEINLLNVVHVKRRLAFILKKMFLN